MKINKFLSLVFLCAAIGSSLQFSCDKVKEKLSVNVGLNETEITFDVPARPLAGSTDSTYSEIYTINLDSLIKAESDELGVHNIRSVKINSCQLTLLNPGIKSFADMEFCKLELSPGNTDMWTTLAQININADQPTTTISVPVNSEVNLKDYFTTDQLQYRIVSKNRNSIATASRIKAAISFTLKVGL